MGARSSSRRTGDRRCCRTSCSTCAATTSLTVSGDAVYADTRVNPDGTLDISRWTRPQHDGPPLRALAVLRWLRTLRSQPAARRNRLRRRAGGRRATPAHRPRVDGRPLARTVARHLGGGARPPLLHVARLGGSVDRRRRVASSRGGSAEATALRAEAQAIRETLDRYWLPRRGATTARASCRPA